jgi:hypothetical protein
VAATAVLSLAGCSSVSPPPLHFTSRVVRPTPLLRHLAPETLRRANITARQTAVAKARAFVQGAPVAARGYSFSSDPVGFVRAAYWQAGVELFDSRVAAGQGAGGMEILFRSAARHGRLHRQTPRVGDLVFFDADTRGSDLYPVQVGLVEQVSADGTITVLGAFRDGPARIRMNLRRPRRRATDDGTPVNDLLRGRQKSPAAEMFRSFARPFG